MNSDISPSPIPEQTNLPPSLTTEINPPQERKKEGFGTKIRQTLNAAGVRVQASRQRKISVPDLLNLTQQSQELILRTVEAIRSEDSKNILVTLDESRDMLRDSFEEFKREQNDYKEQLEQISRSRETATPRRTENAVPISMFVRQKRDVDGLADLRPNTGMNTRYHAYFEALLTTDQNQQQHPSDKAAVIRYIRRRERQRRAEQNRKNHELTDDTIEKQTAEIIENLDGMGMKFEHERQRQNDILRAKVNEKKIKTKALIEASEIIDQAHEANLARQRVEQAQREKIEARLSTARHQQNRASPNTIHVQSRGDDEDSQLNDEQITETNNSIQLLNENDGYKTRRSATPMYGNEDSNEKITNIQI